MNELQMHLFVDHLATEDSEGVQMYAFVEGEDGVTDGGMAAADGARVAMTDGHGAEQHGLGIEGEQTIGQQLADAREILQRLGGLV